NPPVPEPERDAVGVYDALVSASPADFGYVYADRGTVVVEVVGAKGSAMLADMRASTDPPANVSQRYREIARAVKPMRSTIGGVPIRIRKVARSRAETDRLAGEILEQSGKDPVLASSRIWGTVVDRPTGRVVVFIPKVTDAAAARLVELY